MKLKLDDRLKNVEEEFIKLFEIMSDFAFALKRHNGTIKTHFNLNEAYNKDITTKIEAKLNTIAFDRNNNKSYNIEKHESHYNNFNYGNIVIKSMGRNKQESDKMTFHLRNLTTDKSIEEIQNELNITFKQCSEYIGNIQWFTNKFKLDPVSQQITELKLIAKFDEYFDIDELTKKLRNFFGKISDQ